MDNNTTRFTEMPGTPNGKVGQGPESKLPAPFPRRQRLQEEFEQQPELPPNHEEARNDPAQPSKTSACVERLNIVRRCWLICHALVSFRDIQAMAESSCNAGGNARGRARREVLLSLNAQPG
jgi:hypothetical protein